MSRGKRRLGIFVLCVLIAAAGGAYWYLFLKVGEIREFAGATSYVRSLNFSPDGTRAASAHGGGTATAGKFDADFDSNARIWDVATGTVLHKLEGHKSIVSDAVFSPDGRRLATSSHDKTIRIWNADDGQLVKELTGHTSDVSTVRYSSDGKRLVSGGWDKTLRIWDADSGALIRTIEGLEYWVHAIAISPDGKRIAAALSTQIVIQQWDLETGSELGKLEGHEQAPHKLVFLPDGRLVSLSGEFDNGRLSDCNLRIWDVTAGKELKKIPTVEMFKGLALSSDSKKLLTSWTSKSTLWDLAAGSPIYDCRVGSNFGPAAFSPDGGKALLGGHPDGMIRLWRLPR